MEMFIEGVRCFIRNVKDMLEVKVIKCRRSHAIRLLIVGTLKGHINENDYYLLIY